MLILRYPAAVAMDIASNHQVVFTFYICLVNYISGVYRLNQNILRDKNVISMLNNLSTYSTVI